MFEENFLLFLHVIIMVVSFISTLVLGIDSDINEDFKSWIIGLISKIVCIASVVLFVVGSSLCNMSDWVIDDRPYATEQLVALNDNNMTNGRLYLSSGYIEEDLYYQYIVQLNNGGFKSNKVKSSKATLFYTDDECSVEWYNKTKKWLWFEQEDKYVEIYIPEGSITTDYIVDLE